MVGQLAGVPNLQIRGLVKRAGHQDVRQASLDDGLARLNLCTDGKTQGLRGPLHGTPVEATREFVAPLFLAVAAYPQAGGMKRCDSRN